MKVRKNIENRLLFTRTLFTGFIGGILSGIFWLIMDFFNFSEVNLKTYVLRSWISADWTIGWMGNLATVFLMGMISIVIAVIYFLTLKKINSVLIGVAYGIVLWFILFFLLHPQFTSIKPLSEISSNTVVSTVCLFILYGTFIGYSISYDYDDTMKYNRDG